MKKQTVNRMFTVALCALMVFSLFLFTGSREVKADGADVRVYEPVDYSTFATLIDLHKAPTKDGYLFAGWFTDAAGTQPLADKEEAGNVTTVYAKFVPVHLAGVSCQVKANTYTEGVTETELRIVSLADDGEYKNFGFNVYRKLLKNGAYSEDTLCAYGHSLTAETTARFSGMMAGNEKKTPADVFGTDAKDFYFTTVRIGGIPQKVYDTCIFAIQPYWITLDGTYVPGVMEYNRVSDGKNGIVNISVNLKDAQAIAAGALTVNYNKDNFEFDSADVGRVFKEMQVNGEVAGKVSCVGNVADITENVDGSENIYINLRFKMLKEVDRGTSTFSITGEDFCNVDEQSVTPVINDVKF